MTAATLTPALAAADLVDELRQLLGRHDGAGTLDELGQLADELSTVLRRARGRITRLRRQAQPAPKPAETRTEPERPAPPPRRPAPSPSPSRPPTRGEPPRVRFAALRLILAALWVVVGPRIARPVRRTARAAAAAGRWTARRVAAARRALTGGRP